MAWIKAHFFILSLVLVSSFLTGCQTLSADREMQMHKYSRIMSLNQRMMVEDFDQFMLLDRPSDLTRWYVQNNR